MSDHYTCAYCGYESRNVRDLIRHVELARKTESRGLHAPQPDSVADVMIGLSIAVALSAACLAVIA